MPPPTCSNPLVFDLSQGANGECHFIVRLAWDGTSTPPNCNGTVTSVQLSNSSQSQTYYAHLPATKIGKAVYQILPGDARTVNNKQILASAGLVDRNDISPTDGSVPGVYVNTAPPAADETLINP